MIDRTSKLSFSKDNAKKDADEDWGAVWYTDNTAVSEVFNIEADRIEADPHPTELPPDLWDHFGSPRRF